MVDGGRILTQDEAQLARDLQGAAERNLEGSYPELDWAKRTPNEKSVYVRSVGGDASQA